MIRQFDLGRQNRELEPELKAAIEKVIRGGVFILGPNVTQFEQEFAAYLGVEHAAGVASGTDALSLALLAFGVKPGDEVILPANSYPTVFAVTAIGAKPVLADIVPSIFNLNPAKIEAAISKKTKAVIAVHLYGQAADLERILAIVRKNKLKLVEDCAQAHGAQVKVMGKWMKVGTVGDAGCFSFYPTKNLGCFGDGGMVVTNNQEIYKKVKLLRMYGEEERYRSVVLGRNSRLDELQAAILLVKLKYLDEWNSRRREIAKLYESRLRQGFGGQAKSNFILPKGFDAHKVTLKGHRGFCLIFTSWCINSLFLVPSIFRPRRVGTAAIFSKKCF